LGTVDPADGPAAADEIDRCVEVLGLRGIAWHHRFIGQAMDDARMDACLEKLAEHRLPAFVHIIADSTLEAPWRLEALASRFPEQQFVALDAFSSANQSHSLPHIAANHPNIAFDTAVMISVGHMIDRFIETAGSDRLCLGTNFYSFPRLFSTPFPLAEIHELGLAPDALRAVLGGNARRILGLS
jgi:predicted TIM-barrel fold metal-dependent hydrolase